MRGDSHATRKRCHLHQATRWCSVQYCEAQRGEPLLAAAGMQPLLQGWAPHAATGHVGPVSPAPAVASKIGEFPHFSTSKSRHERLDIIRLRSMALQHHGMHQWNPPHVEAAISCRATETALPSFKLIRTPSLSDKSGKGQECLGYAVACIASLDSRWPKLTHRN